MCPEAASPFPRRPLPRPDAPPLHAHARPTNTLLLSRGAELGVRVHATGEFLPLAYEPKTPGEQERAFRARTLEIARRFTALAIATQGGAADDAPRAVRVDVRFRSAPRALPG